MKLFSGTAPAAGAIHNIPNHGGRTFAPVQSTSATSCTVEIQGRMGKDQAWEVLTTLTDNDAETVAIFPQMRANVTAVTGQCEVDIWVLGTAV